MGFREAKVKILKALKDGAYQHESRGDIDEKNLLSVGEITLEEVIGIIGKCRGQHHTMSQHRAAPSVTIHVIKCSGWYIKFYFLDPNAVLISVHKLED